MMTAPGYLSSHTMALCMRVFETLNAHHSASAGFLFVMALTRNSPREDHDALLRGWFIHGLDPVELELYCARALSRPTRPEVFESHLEEISAAFDHVCRQAQAVPDPLQPEIVLGERDPVPAF